MTKLQADKIKELIEKYNDILIVSMRLAIAEDFINLMLLNRDDTGFVLKDLFENKQEFNKLIMSEFIKKNRTSVLTDLNSMESDSPDFRVTFSRKSKR